MSNLPDFFLFKERISVEAVEGIFLEKETIGRIYDWSKKWDVKKVYEMRPKLFWSYELYDFTELCIQSASWGEFNLDNFSLGVGISVDHLPLFGKCKFYQKEI